MNCTAIETQLNTIKINASLGHSLANRSMTSMPQATVAFAPSTTLGQHYCFVQTFSHAQYLCRLSKVVC